MDEDEEIPTIEDLFPDLSADERAEVEESLREYVALMVRIFARLESSSDSADVID